MASLNKYYFVDFIIFLLLLMGLFFPINTLASLTEEEQFQIVQGFFKDGFHELAQEEAEEYLNKFPEGRFREAVVYLKIRSGESSSEDKSGVADEYQNYRQEFPTGQWTEDAMFREGILRASLLQYERSISILGEFTKKFPESRDREIALYWLGNSLFYAAELSRQNQSSEAISLYRKASNTLSKITTKEQLTKEQKIEWLHLLGLAYQHQQEFQKAKKWLQEYVNHIQDSDRQAKIYYQLALNEWGQKNFKEAIAFFDKLEQFPQFSLRDSTLFLKAEGEYQLLLGESETRKKGARMEAIVGLYQNYLKTGDKQYQKIAKERIATLYYQLGQSEWKQQNYKKAIAFFDELEQFPQFPLRHPTLFLKAEGEYQILLSQPESQHNKARLEAIVLLFQNYLKTTDRQYLEDSKARIASLYYQLGQKEWKQQNYKEAIAFFDELEQFPRFPLRNPTLFLKAEGEYQILLSVPESQHKGALMETVILLYQNYLKTEDRQYQDEAKARIASLYYQLGQREWDKQNYEEAIAFFEKLEQFPKFPLRHSTLFLKAEGEYQILLSQLELRQKGARMEAIVQLYQNYLKTEDRQYQDDAKARIASLYYQLGQMEWEKQNYKEAIVFFDELEQFPHFPLRQPTLFLKAEGKYQIFLSQPESRHNRVEMETIAQLYQNYLETQDDQYQEEANARIASLYYQLGQIEWKKQNYKEAITFFEKLEQFPQFPLRDPALFLKAEGEYQIMLSQAELRQKRSLLEAIVQLYQNYLKTEDSEYQDDARARIALLYYQLGQNEWGKQNYKEAIAFFEKLEQFPQFPHRHPALFLRAEGEYQILLKQPESQHKRVRLEAIVQLYQNYLKTKDNQYQDDAKARVVSLYYQLGQQEWQRHNYREAITFFNELEQFPGFPLLHPALFLKAEGEYQILLSLPESEHKRVRLEAIVQLYQNYLKTGNSQYQSDANARIAVLYYRLGQNEWKKQNFKEAIGFFDKLEQFPQFPLRHPTLFLKAEGEYQILFGLPESQQKRTRLEAIVLLFQNYLETRDDQYQDDARARIALLYYQIGQIEWEKQNYKDAIAFFDKLEQFPQFPLRHTTLFLKAEGEYQILLSQPQTQQTRVRLETIVRLYQNYLETKDKQFRNDARARIASLYYQLGQIEWDKQNYEEAIAFFDELEQFPQFPLRHPTLFLKAEGEYQILLNQPESQHKQTRLEGIIQLYQNYLKTEDSEYQDDARARIASLYYQLGQIEWDRQNYQEAIAFFDELEQFPQFPLRHPALFLKAEGEYQILMSEPQSQHKVAHLEAIVKLYQNYLNTEDSQYEADANARIALLYYQLGQLQWKKQNYKEAIAFFDELEQFPLFHLRHPALFLKAEGEYQILLSQPETQHKRVSLEAIIQLYQNYLKTGDSQYEGDARGRIASLYYQLGQIEWDKQNYEEAIAFFDELEQFPQFPLRHPTLFLKAEGEYQILLNQPESQRKRTRLEGIIQLYQNYLNTEDSEYQDDARGRIASLYYQLGQIEWDKQNFKEAIAFFDELEQFPQFPLRHPTLFLKAEGEYQILLSEPQSQHKGARMETIVKLYQNYLKTEDSQYVDDANARIALLYYQLGQLQWKRQNFKEAIAFFDELEQFPLFPLRHPSLFFKAEGEYQILLAQPESQHKRVRLEAIIQLYQNYLITEDDQYQADARARVASLYYQLGQEEWEKQNYKEAITFFDNLEQFPQFPLRHPTLFLKAEGEYQILMNQPKSQHNRVRLEDIVQLFKNYLGTEDSKYETDARARIASLFYQLGQNEWEEKNYKEAIAFFDELEQFPQFPLRHPTLFLKAEGEYQISLSRPESEQKRAHLETIAQLYKNYLKTGDSQYQSDASARIASLYYQLGLREWDKQNYKEAIAFFDELEQFPQFPQRLSILFLKAEGEYQILLSKPDSPHNKARIENIIQLYQNYLQTESSQYRSDAEARVASLYYQLGQYEWQEKNYEEAIAFFDELEQFPQFPLRHSTLFLKAEGEYQILLSQPESQNKRVRVEGIIQLYQNYLKTEDEQYQDDARSRVALLYYQLGQQEWEKRNYKEAIAFFNELEQFPQFPLLHSTLFLKAEGEYQILLSEPESQHDRAGMEKVIYLYQNYLKTGDNRYQDDSRARIASLYYQLGQNEWEQENYKEAIAFFDELEQFPQFPLRHPALFLKAEGEYQILLNQPESQHERTRLEAIVRLYQNYLETQDRQYRNDARARIASLYYQLGQQEWEKQNYKEAIAFFDELEQFPQFPLRHPTLFLKAEGEYQILLSQPEPQHNRVRLEGIIQLYQNYLKTGDSQYHNDARARIASLYYQIGQNEWEKQNYKEAIAYFDELEQFPQFPLRHTTLFLKAEGEYQILLSQPEPQPNRVRLEGIIQLYQNYLKTGDSQYKSDARARVASLYYQLGQNEWEKQNYKEAIAYFDELEQFPQFPLRHPTLFLKAEGEYQILLSQPESEQKRIHLETIVQLYQNYLETRDSQYQDDANSRIASLYYQIGQQEWEKQNYKEAIAFFDKLEQFPQFPLRHPALFLKAEGEYQILLSQPKSEHERAHLEAIAQIYQNYLETQDSQYRNDARARIASLYYQLGQNEWEKQNYKEAIAYFDELEQFPQFPLRHSALFLKAEGEYKILLNQPEFQNNRVRMEAIIQLYQNYLKTEDNQFRSDARGRIASLYYQLGQSEWEKQNYKEAIVFFNELEQFPLFPLRHSALFLIAEGGYQILLSQPESQRNRTRPEAIVQLYQNYLETQDGQYQDDANSRIASLYYQIGQQEWEKQNYKEAIAFFDKLEQFPQFPLRHPTLFLKAEGEYQILRKLPKSQQERTRLEAIVQLYQNYLETEDFQYQDDAKARIASLYYQLGQNEWEQQNYKEANAFFDELEQFPQFPLRHPTLFLKAEGEYQILMSQPESQHNRVQMETIVLLYQNYLKTEDSQYQEEAKARIASLYYQLGQNEWEQQNYKEAISFFDELEQFPQFPLRHQTLFLKAEGEYQILQSQSESRYKRVGPEAIVKLYQNYLETQDSQYQDDANARIASLFYQIGQQEWEKQNYKEAITYFDKLEQFPQFPLRHPTLFLKAEGEYQILFSQPESQHERVHLEAIVALYQAYLETEDSQYRADARARIASLYYQIGQQEWEKQNYKEAIAFFDELEQFPQFPLLDSTLFLKAEGEYQILLDRPEPEQNRSRMEAIVLLYQNYLKTEENQYQGEAKARIASLYYQIGQQEWEKQNYEEAIAFFDRLEQFPQFPLRHQALFLKAEGEYQILQSQPESQLNQTRLESIVLLYLSYLETEDSQYQADARARIASLYYQLGQNEWEKQNYKEAITFFDELEQFPQFPLRHPTLFLKAEGEYLILLSQSESEHKGARLEAIVRLYQNYLETEDSQYQADARAKIASLYYQLGQNEWEKQNYKEAIAYFDELEQFPQFPLRHPALFLKAEGEYQILMSQSESQHNRVQMETLVLLYQNYLKTEDSQYQGEAKARIASLYYQIGQQEWEKKNYKEAISFFDELEQFPHFPLRHQALFLKAEGEYQILQSQPESQYQRVRLETIVQLYQNYLETQDSQYQNDANARIASLYYQIGQQEWEKLNYKEAIAFFDKLEQFPQFPLRHPTLFLKAEGEYQILFSQPESQHERVHLEAIIALYQTYLETGDSQYRADARARIASLYYQIGQQEWEKQNYKEAIAFFDELEQFPQFPLLDSTLFLKAEGEYQILLDRPEPEQNRSRMEAIVLLYQNYLKTEENQYQGEAKARIASLYYQIGQQEWKKQNYKEAIAFFDRLEQFPQFPLRHQALFLKAEGEYQILQSQPESQLNQTRLESIVLLYRNYLETEDSQYQADARARIASLYYQLGQNEWEKQNYKEAITFFDELEQFPQFPLRHPTLFLKAEGEYLILLSQSESEHKGARLEAIVRLYQDYLETEDSQYQADARAKIASLYYQLGQNEWEKQNYEEAIAYFDELEQFPQFPLRQPALFLKAEGEYQILMSQSESQHNRVQMETIVLLYQNYLKTEDSQYQGEAKARIASLYYQIGQQEWEQQNYKEAISFFDELEQFPHFPLRHQALFLKAEGEYQILQKQPESQYMRVRLETIVQLYQNYLETQDSQYQNDANARIASLYYQIGQQEWEKLNYKEAIAFFDKLEQFPQFPLRHPTLFLKAEGEYQILLSQPESQHERVHLEAIVALYQTYLETGDSQYRADARARIASLYYQIGQQEWEKQNYKEAIAFFDELEQFPQFPLLDSTLFLKAEGEYQILLDRPEPEQNRSRMEAIVLLYQNYLKTEENQYQGEAKARIASLYYQIGQQEWEKQNYEEAIAFFDRLEQFPQFPLRHQALFLKAEGEYQILQSQPESQLNQTRLESIVLLYLTYLETEDSQYQADARARIASLYYQLGQNEWEKQNYKEAITFFDELEQFPQFPLRHPTLFLKAEGEYLILLSQSESEHKGDRLEAIVRLYQDYLETEDSQYQADARAKIASLYYQLGQNEWEKQNYKEAIAYFDELEQFPQFPLRHPALFLKAEGEYQILMSQSESQHNRVQMETLVLLYQNYLKTEDSQYQGEAKARIASLYYQIGQQEWEQQNYKEAISFFDELEQFPHFPLRHQALFLKAEGEYQILQSQPESQYQRVRLETIVQLYQNYLETQDRQYQNDANARIASLYYQIGQQEWEKQNYKEAIAFFDKLEQFPQFPLRHPTLFLKAEGEYQILLSQPESQHERVHLEAIVALYQTYLETEDSQYRADARARIASLYYQIGRQEWEKQNYKEAIAFFDELEQFPQFPLLDSTLFLKAEGEYQILLDRPEPEQNRSRMEAIVLLYQNYLKTEENQYQGEAKARIASLYYQIGQQEWEKQNYEEAIAFFDRLEQFPQFPLRHQALFLKAEGEYQILQSQPESQLNQTRLESIVLLYLSYLETEDSQYQADARARIASLYYQLGQNEWEKQNYKEAITFFDELEQFPQFPLRHPSLFLKAEGEYLILLSQSESEHKGARLEAIVRLYQDYLETEDSQYQADARTKIASLYYQLGQNEWEKQNYKEAIAYFDELEQFPQFPLRHPALFLKAEGEYQILMSQSESQHNRVQMETIVLLYQNYLKTEDSQYQGEAKARIASLYYQIGQQEWEQQNYKEAISFFDELEQFPQFSLRHQALFLKAEGEYQILQSQPESQYMRVRLETIVQLYQNYLETQDSQYQNDANARIASLYYQIGQQEWEKLNYKEAIAFFDKLEQFPQFPLRHPTLFLKAEGEYQILFSQPESQHERVHLEAIVALYQTYLETGDSQYRADARARIASLYYQIGQQEWEKQNYKEAIAFFDELEQFPQFPLLDSTLFLKAEGEYQILLDRPEPEQNRSRMEAIALLYQNYLKTEENQYQGEAKARIASLYYQIGQQEWEKQNYKEAIAFFDRLEQFPQFPLRHQALFLKAEGEYQILQSQPESQLNQTRLESIVLLYLSYLETEDSQYQADARARIASLYYQLGQNEWEKQNYKEAITFFDELEQFPQFPLRHPSLFLKAEGEYLILLSQSESEHKGARLEAIVRLYQDYLETEDSQYQADARAKIASLYYQLGQNEWEKQNYKEAIAYFDELEQFPQFPLRHPALFLKAEGEYQILQSEPQSKQTGARKEAIIQLYQNYLKTEDSQYKDDANTRVALLYYQLGLEEWEKQNYQEALAFFDELEQFPQFRQSHSTLFLKAEGQYQILQSEPQSQHKRARKESIIQLYQNYLKTEDSKFQDDAKARVASLYYQLGQEEWEKQNYKEAIAFFDELEQFPQFPLRHPTLFLKAEGEYQILLGEPESQHKRARMESIIQLYQNYLETEDRQYQNDANARIASLYYQLGQLEWEKRNYKEAIAFFDELEQFPQFPLRHSTLFLKAEGEYQILLSQPESQHKRIHLETIVKFFQNYLKSQDSKYEGDARARIALLYYQIGQLEWEKQNYKEAVVFFEKVEQFPEFSQRHLALFLKAEGQYQILLSEPQTLRKRARLEAIAQLYQNYLKTEDNEYQSDANARIASLYYQLGQNEWEKQNYKEAVAFFNELEQFPQFSLRHPTLFLKAEGEYQIFLSQPESQHERARLEAIAQLYQNYLVTRDEQYRSDARARVASLYYQLGQNEWEKQNYREAITFFDELKQFPQFALRHTALFLKAEGEYQILLNQPESQHERARLEAIAQLYQNYLLTRDEQYRSDARARIASLYFQLGQNEWKKQNYKEALTFFDELKQFPQFPLRHPTLFLKAEGEYQMLLSEPKSKHERTRLEAIVQLYQNYLETGDSQYQGDANARIAALYYQLGQNEWKKQNYKEALAFFDELEQFPQFPLHHPVLYLKAEGEYQILLIEPKSKHERTRLEAIAQLYQNYLLTKDNQYQGDANARIAALYYQLGQQEWEKQNYKDAVAFFDKLEQFPQFPLRQSTLFFKAEGEYQILLSQPESQQKRAHLEGIVELYQNYLQTEDKQYHARALRRIGKLFLELNEPLETISYYMQYLKTGDSTHVADVHYELGQLFINQEDNVQAIRELEFARKSKEYQNDWELILQLSKLLERENRHRELQNLLAEARKNSMLSDQHRNYFWKKDIDIALKNNQCEKILKENREVFSTLKPADRQFVLYARSVCFHQTKQWKQAVVDLHAIKHNPNYETFAFEKLIEIYQETKDWNSLATHIEEFLKRKNFPLLPDHFQILLDAYHQLEDLKNVAATYIRWESVFPKEVQKSEFLIDWAETEEKLNRLEKSRELYKKILSLPEIDLELREGIVFQLADSYLDDEDYLSVVQIYEQDLIPHLSETTAQQKYALVIGQIYYDSLQEYDKAWQWLQKVDRGQATDLEVRAILLLSDIAEELGEMDQAIQLLNNLTERSLKPEWALNVNYRLAILYEKHQLLPEALKKYRVMAGDKAITKKEDLELQEYAEKRIQEIEKNNAIQELDQLIKNKSWQDVALRIRNGFSQQNFTQSHELYELLVYAERHQENWQGILDAYQDWGKLDASKAESLEALLTRGEAALKLSDNQLAEKFYSNALEIVSIEDQATLIFLTKSLSVIYEHEKNYSKVVDVYEQAYPLLRDTDDKIHFAYKLGSFYLSPLKDKTQALKWFAEADKGGIQEEELSAAWQLAELESDPVKTIKILAKMAFRPISKNLEWYITVNLKLGILYEQQEQWRKAKLHYDRVIKTKTSEHKKYEQFARERSNIIAVYLKSLKESQ